jgi:NAD-dependent deacetylase
MIIPPLLLKSLATATRVAALTGAGISAESGVPTFRGANGLWKKMRAEELASMEGFLKNPALVWEWYAHRRAILQTVQPNAGHRALVDLERLYPGLVVITQNVDGLHRRAGSSRVYELHGNIERNSCTACGEPHPSTAVALRDGRPMCTRCGGLVRPDVVWFGELLPEEEWEESVRASRAADLFLSIGTSGLVFPAASLPLVARDAGALIVEVNPEESPLTVAADVSLRGPAGEVLPALVEAARGVTRSPRT